MEIFEPKDLTDEHVIPEALHGRLVLENGACRSCARFSNATYENEALNGALQLPRLLLGLKGKRGKTKADLRHLPPVYRGNIYENKGERIRLTDFPPEEYPRSFALLHYLPAGLLAEVDRGSTGTMAGYQMFTLGGNAIKENTVEQRIKNGPFQQMLAKIAYCYAVAEKGLSSFDGDQIRAMLRGERNDIYNFVGSKAHPGVLTTRHLHALYVRRRGPWLTVLVDLFASLSDTTNRNFVYEVVVGRSTPRDRARSD